MVYMVSSRVSRFGGCLQHSGESLESCFGGNLVFVGVYGLFLLDRSLATPLQSIPPPPLLKNHWERMRLWSATLIACSVARILREFSVSEAALERCGTCIGYAVTAKQTPLWGIQVCREGASCTVAAGWVRGQVLLKKIQPVLDGGKQNGWRVFEFWLVFVNWGAKEITIWERGRVLAKGAFAQVGGCPNAWVSKRTLVSCNIKFVWGSKNRLVYIFK